MTDLAVCQFKKQITYVVKMSDMMNTDYQLILRQQINENEYKEAV
jgi:hypothetical protein